MDILIVLGVALSLLGIIGSIVPFLPGPAFSFAALVLLFMSKSAEGISAGALIIFGVTMLCLVFINYIAPVMGAKFFGASKKGTWGAAIGTFLGLIFFPPLGIFLGALAGAILGELYAGKKGGEAIRAGIGTLLGSLSVIFLQVAFSIASAIVFFLGAF